MADNIISTNKAPKPVGMYPHARRVGNLLFLSGVGPRRAGSDATDSEVPGLSLDKNGNFLEFDFEAQCHAVFQNVKAVLEANRGTISVQSEPGKGSKFDVFLPFVRE